MKRIYISLLMVAVLAAVLSCSKRNSDSPSQDGKIHINITGEMGEFNPGVTKSEVVSVMRVEWKGGEKVYVYGKKNGESVISNLGELTVSKVESGGRVAVLSGQISEPASQTKLSLLHGSCLKSAPEISNGKISVNMAEQQSPDTVDFIVYASVDYSQTNVTDLKTSFTFATSVLKVNVSGLEVNRDINSASLSSIETSCDISITEESVEVSASSTKGMISKNLKMVSQSSGTASFWMAIPYVGKGSHTLSVAQASDTSLVTNFLSGVYANGKCLNANVVAYSTTDVAGETVDEGQTF